MKKLFTLSIAIFCAVAINAQFTESGNGFAETFTYDNGTVYVEGQYGEDATFQWTDGSVIEDGKLKSVDGVEIGIYPLEMDLTGNTDITFKYQFPAEAGFGIWIETNAGTGGEIFPEDFNLGLSELMDYTFDASAVLDETTQDPLDLTDVAEIWIMGEGVGTFYLDDIVIGDGSLTGISSKLVKSTLQVYPNPASEEFRIGTDIKSLSVYNSIGQIVYSMENYQKRSSVDISDLGKGLYIIKADDKAHKLMVR